MKTTLFSTISMICLAALMSNALAQPAAAQPQTETITFAVLFDYTGPSGVSLDAIGEDTNGIFSGKYLTDSVGQLVFGGNSPDCEDFVVAGTTWVTASRATIINEGGPLYGTVYFSGFGLPPERYMLSAQNITAVRACFLNISGGFADVQADSVGAEAVCFIVTGEFRVNN